MAACARCPTPATSLLTFAYAERQSWLADLGMQPAPAGIALCERHANAITPPRGWVLHDRRAPLRALFADPGIA